MLTAYLALVSLVFYLALGLRARCLYVSSGHLGRVAFSNDTESFGYFFVFRYKVGSKCLVVVGQGVLY